MNPVIGLILIGVGIAALAKEFLSVEDKNNAKNSSNRNSGGDSGKQDSADSTDRRRDRIVVNNIYRGSKPQPAGSVDKKGKKDDKQDIDNPKKDPDK